MYKKEPTIVVNRETGEVKLFPSQNEAFQSFDVPRSTGQENLDTKRAIKNKYVFYRLPSWIN